MSNKRIALDKLRQCLVSDPYYGVWSAATESIINSVYQENSGDAVYGQFGNHFGQTSFKHDHQHHLICLWCGLMGLPTYFDGKPTRWQGPDFIDNYQKSIEIELDEFKAHLKRYEWPLPVGLFHNEPDNTAERVKKDQQEEFQGGFDDNLRKDKLESELEELLSVKPANMAEWEMKKKEKANYGRQIDEIMHGLSSQSESGRKGGRQPKKDSALQEAINRIATDLKTQGTNATIGTLKTWFVRTNANSKNPNFQPYSFDHPIPDCDELYIDGDKLIYTDSSGKSQSLSLRSLERYLKDAKLN